MFRDCVRKAAFDFSDQMGKDSLEPLSQVS